MNPIKARKQIVRTFLQLGSIRATARRGGTSRQVVRKWVSRHRAEGEQGLMDRSRRPRRSPRQTPPELEPVVLTARRETGLGRRRLALYLQSRGVTLSPHTIRHILRRHGYRSQRRRRQSVYPALWAWEVQEPFSLLQTDGKAIHDKGTLGTLRVTHLQRHHLPCYQWTACDGRNPPAVPGLQPHLEPHLWPGVSDPGVELIAGLWGGAAGDFSDRSGKGVWGRQPSLRAGAE